MYLVSSRKAFWDDNVVSDKPDKVREVNVTTGESKKRKWADYQRLITGQSVLILCHGYNNEQADVLSAYRTVEDHHAKYMAYFDVVVGYTWPGGDDAFDYPDARRRASAITPRFAKLLQVTLPACAELGVMSHSLGARISLVACERLQEMKVPKTVKLSQFMLAAAVDHESLEVGQRHYNATLYSNYTYVFHSIHDIVLSPGYVLYENDDALGHSGPENVADIHHTTKVVNCKHVVQRHGDYKRTPQIYTYLKQELPTAAGPQFSTLR